MGRFPSLELGACAVHIELVDIQLQSKGISSTGFEISNGKYSPDKWPREIGTVQEAVEDMQHEVYGLTHMVLDLVTCISPRLPVNY